MRILFILCAVVVLFGGSCLLFGCARLSYYLQSATGQMEILSKRQPISELLAADTTDKELKKRLQLALEIREFAASDLGLPDNDSYRSYVDLQRPYVVWNVVATPEFSLEPVTWCFPVVGCLPYRGYYHQEDAEAFAAGLQGQGQDTATYGVAAYSTLNWFSDPVLNTFSSYSEEYLAGMIFHELAHQMAYVPGHADFNEAYAETVERVGVERWFQHQGDPEKAASTADRQSINRQFIDLVLATRQKLQELYHGDLGTAAMREQKTRLLAEFQEQLRDFRNRQQLLSGFKKWLDPGLNNALFSSVSTYNDLTPAFEQLLSLKNGNLIIFHAEVKRLAKLEQAERVKVLAHLSNLYLAAHQQVDAVLQ
jgi:predicted aminopeptidase